MQDVARPQPIETAYNGYRFRSRLEARWAVFFDALGLRYEYEKEGFDLGEAGRYLPDFWLPDLECWLEVKPHGVIDASASRKIRRFAQSGESIVVALGPPHDRRTYPNMALCRLGANGAVEVQYVEFALCVSCGDRISLVRVYGDIVDFGGLRAAEDRAKAARFEFGESGHVSRQV